VHWPRASYQLNPARCINDESKGEFPNNFLSTGSHPRRRIVWVSSDAKFKRFQKCIPQDSPCIATTASWENTRWNDFTPQM